MSHTLGPRDVDPPDLTPLGYPWDYGHRTTDDPSEYGLRRDKRFGQVAGEYAAKCPPMNPDDRGTVRYSAPGRQVRP